MPLPRAQTAEPEQRTSEHPSSAPNVGVHRAKPMCGHVLDRLAKDVQRGFRFGMPWIKSSEGVSQFS